MLRCLRLNLVVAAGLLVVDVVLKFLLQAKRQLEGPRTSRSLHGEAEAETEAARREGDEVDGRQDLGAAQDSSPAQLDTAETLKLRRLRSWRWQDLLWPHTATKSEKALRARICAVRAVSERERLPF